MILNAVDMQDRPIGVVDRKDVFEKHANFRVVHVFVFNSANELLLQKISSGRRHPHQWGSSVAGYVLAEEDYAKAGNRKVALEIGVRNAALTAVGKTNMNDMGSLKFIMLYRTTYDGPFFPDTSQISQLEFVSIPKIIQMRDREERIFTPTFLHLLDFFHRVQG